MMRPRSHPTTSYSLARLLADLPLERLTALGNVWAVADPECKGQVAALYRRMTDADARRSILESVSDDARLVFRRLDRAGKPLARAELLRLLPFSDDGLEVCLAALEAVGLAWSRVTAGRAQISADRLWFVPHELSEAASWGLTRRWRSVAGASHRIEPSSDPPRPRVLDRIPGPIRQSWSLADTISSLADRARPATGGQGSR